MALTASRRPLTAVSSFNYLGRFLSVSYNDWPAVIWNLRRVHQKWAFLSQVLGRDGADAWVLGVFNTAVVQVVFLYRLESWVISPRIGKALGSIHNLEIR